MTAEEWDGKKEIHTKDYMVNMPQELHPIENILVLS